MAGMRILITGITGFVGSHLAEYALTRGAEVFGSVRWRSKTEHIEHLRERVILIESDLRDILSVRTVLEQARPDYIIHLAAQSFVQASWQTPVETFYTNVVSQMNLFEVCREIASRLERIFLRDATGRRPVYGGTTKFQTDPNWRDLVLFYEYFHGDNGAGLGASHQTGWTGLAAVVIQLFNQATARGVLEGGLRSRHEEPVAARQRRAA